MKTEKPNNLPHSKIQFQHLQETLFAELAQRQKIIEEQQQLLFQQQLNIQELMNEKLKQQQLGLLSEPNTYNNPSINPNS